jgi:hypothetical protein
MTIKSLLYHNNSSVLFWVQRAFVFVLCAVVLAFFDTVNGRLVRWLAHQRMKGGALIACMLEEVPMRLGLPFFVHRPELNLPFKLDLPATNPERNWVRGIITQIKTAAFTVELEEGQGTKLIQRGGDATSTNPSKILELGTQKLRCMPADTITLSLLQAGGPTAATEKGEVINAYEMSTHCRPGEIDYFFSHSWSDDVDLKWEHLEIAFEDFRHKASSSSERGSKCSN